MVNKIELRVHAGAPSGRRDDDRYRALAEAYLGFTGHVIQQAELGGNEPAIPHTPPTPASSPPQEDQVDASITIYPPEDSTFIDDTQLAYNALESQLQTSSLTVPEVTPLKRHLEPDEESPWPEDLHHHSPEVSRAHAVQADQAEPVTSPPSSPAMQRLVKKPRLQQREIKAPMFKPFKVPARRAQTGAHEPATPKTGKVPIFDLAEGPGTDLPYSQSSYLKTPVLVTPERLHPERRERTTRASSRLDQSAITFTEHKTTRVPAVSGVANYRERTPQQPQFLPYVPLPEASGIGIAFIGAQYPLRTAVQQDAQHQSQASASLPDTTSELPSTYSLSDIMSETSKARPRHSQRSTSDPGPSGGGEGCHDQEASARSGSQPPPAPHRVPTGIAPIQPLGDEVARHASSVRPTKPQALGSTSHGDVTRQPHEAGIELRANILLPEVAKSGSRTSLDPPMPAVPAFNDLPLTIEPPEPTVSIERYVTHITQSLCYLAESSVLAEHYKPTSQTRSLRPLERGYWLVDPKQWPQQLQINFWRYLDDMVGSGKAGWGVWCVRNTESETGSTAKPSDTLGMVKVYCWGEVVKHVYFMLYVASQSKVRRLGLQWIDAEEKVVVQMRAG